MSREIICPAIYRHFKGLNYATMGCSTPVSHEELVKYKSQASSKGISKLRYVTAVYTEDLKTEIVIFNTEGNIEGKLVHLVDQSSEDLVIYKPLYPFKFPIVARPKSMFASKVDKVKYPDVEQEYRFELVKY